MLPVSNILLIPPEKVALVTKPISFLVMDFNIKTQVSALPTFMINAALFMTGFFIASCDVFMDKMLDTGCSILKRSYPY